MSYYICMLYTYIFSHLLNFKLKATSQLLIYIGYFNVLISIFRVINILIYTIFHTFGKNSYLMLKASSHLIY